MSFREGNCEVELVALRCADGTVAVLRFVVEEYRADGSLRYRQHATRQNVEREIERLTRVETNGQGEQVCALGIAKVPVQSWRFIEPHELPQERTYRDAWKDTGRSIEHDMSRAREIHRTHLRAARSPLFEKLDAAYQKADEAGNTKTKKEIAARRQALRDVTEHPAIEAAATVDDLKMVWPL